jgi:hypothetical protein
MPAPGAFGDPAKNTLGADFYFMSKVLCMRFECWVSFGPCPDALCRKHESIANCVSA